MRKGTRALLLTLLMLTGASAVQADAPVWVVSKGNDRLFIGGTIHVLSKTDYPLPLAFDKAYRQSEQVVLETDLQKLQSPEFQAKLLSKVVYPDGKTLKDVLSSRTYQRLETYMAGRGLPMAGFEKFKPGMLAMTMMVLELQRLGLVEAGVDEFFNSRALEDRKSLGQLETVEEQIAFLSTMGDGREDALITHTLRDIKTLPELMASLKRAWRNGDRAKIKEIAVTPIKNNFPRVYRRLLVDRNRAWIPRIEAMLKTKEVEFVLVGAAHLVGEEGLLNKLSALGYKVQQP